MVLNLGLPGQLNYKLMKRALNLCREVKQKQKAKAKEQNLNQSPSIPASGSKRLSVSSGSALYTEFQTNQELL